MLTIHHDIPNTQKSNVRKIRTFKMGYLIIEEFLHKNKTQLLPIQENFDLRECQSPVNWELVNMKYLVDLFLLLYCRHV